MYLQHNPYQAKTNLDLSVRIFTDFINVTLHFELITEHKNGEFGVLVVFVLFLHLFGMFLFL